MLLRTKDRICTDASHCQMEIIIQADSQVVSSTDEWRQASSRTQERRHPLCSMRITVLLGEMCKCGIAVGLLWFITRTVHPIHGWEETGPEQFKKQSQSPKSILTAKALAESSSRANRPASLHPGEAKPSSAWNRTWEFVESPLQKFVPELPLDVQRHCH